MALFLVLLFVRHVLVILRLIITQEAIFGPRLAIVVVIVVDGSCLDLLQVLNDGFDILLNVLFLIHVLLVGHINMYFVRWVVVERVLILRYLVLNIDPKGHRCLVCPAAGDIPQ